MRDDDIEHTGQYAVIILCSCTVQPRPVCLVKEGEGCLSQCTDPAM